MENLVAIFYSNILFYTVLLWYSCYMLGCVIIQNHRISFTKSLFYFLKKLFLFNWKIKKTFSKGDPVVLDNHTA